MDIEPNVSIKWYKNPIFYAVIIITIIIIAFVIYDILYKPPTVPNTSSQTIAEQSAMFANISYWGPSSNIPGNPLSQCNIFTFQGFISDSIAEQGDVTLNPDILNACGTTGSFCTSPIPAGSQICLDVDQISAQLQQRTCTAQGTDSIGCRDYEGNKYAVGQVNDYYNACSLTPCTNSTVASIATNFQFNPNPAITLANAHCIFPVFGITGTTGISGSTGTTGTTSYLQGISGSTCDLDLSQLWRITRADFIASTGGFKVDPSGMFARIQNRSTGLCLAPIGSTGATGSTGNTGNTGSSGVTNGSLLTLVPCRATYPWLFSPSLQIVSLTSPPQFVWSPTPVSLTTTADIINYINNNKPLSMVVVDGTAVMLPFALDNSTQSNYSAQYLDYALFNLILTSNYPL